MLTRVPEPEVMDGPDEATEYDSMDHSEVNRLFVDDLLELLGDPVTGPLRVLDLGTGTALIPIELCQRCPTAIVTAVDAAPSMIELAQKNVADTGLADRITPCLADVNRQDPAPEPYDIVMSNSIIHHLHNPAPAIAYAIAATAQGGVLLFRDLMRPDDEQTLEKLVEQYAAGCTPRQRQLFSDSLRAAFTVDEVQSMVKAAGGNPQGVSATSDRHWTWTCRR